MLDFFSYLNSHCSKSTDTILCPRGLTGDHHVRPAWQVRARACALPVSSPSLLECGIQRAKTHVLPEDSNNRTRCTKLTG